MQKLLPAITMSIGTLVLLGSCTNAGDPCKKNEECDSHYCVKINKVKQCAASCTKNNCSKGLECKHAEAGNPSSPGICVGVNTKPCGICESDADCLPGDLCMPDGTQSFCLSDCSFTNECPSGYTCMEQERQGVKVGKLCVPANGSCACDVSKNGSQRVCYNSNDIGTCEGTETCNGKSWVDCTAADAVTEICDGIDNDCDGNVDEDATGAPLSIPCEINLSGRSTIYPECKNGKKYCDSTIRDYGVCVLPDNHGFDATTLPTEEIYCDGKDDDCDGSIDENLLGTGNFCTSCSDNCAPGFVMDDKGNIIDDKNAIPSCIVSSSGIAKDNKCGAAKCKFPYFDVDGDLNNGYDTRTGNNSYLKLNAKNNGCEMRDDTVTINGKEMLNNVAARARDFGTIGKGTTRKLCEGYYLPYDDPENHEAADLDGPMGVDYYKVTLKGEVGTVYLYMTMNLTQENADAGDSSVAISTEPGSCTGLDFKDKSSGGPLGLNDSLDKEQPPLVAILEATSGKNVDCTFYLKISVTAANAMIPYKYYLALASTTSKGAPASPIKSHTCQ